jgi:hypothetical protein
LCWARKLRNVGGVLIARPGLPLAWTPLAEGSML